MFRMLPHTCLAGFCCLFLFSEVVWSQATTIAVTEFMANPDGSDSNFEWVEIFNYGNAPVNLTGWELRDEDSDADSIPAFTLSGGSFGIIAKSKSNFESRWLSGTPTASVLEVSGLTVANGGDEIALFDGTNTQQWGLAYDTSVTDSRAVFLAVDDFSTTTFGSKAAPGVNFDGVDPASGNLGYESNNNTADPSVVAVTDGSADTGSPLAGNYTTIGPPAPASIFTHTLPRADETTTIDFNNFVGLGFEPIPAAGQLDSDNFAVAGLDDGNLDFGDTGTSGDFARGESAGGESFGGIYAFDPNNDGDRALGVQPSAADFTPGNITVRLPNETGNVIEQLAFSVDVLINNDEDRANSFDVSYSTDGTTFSPLQGLTSIEAADALGFQTTQISGVVANLGLLDGEFLFLRFSSDDVSGSGSRDEFAIDNLVLTQVPEPASVAIWCLLAGVVAVAGRRFKKARSSCP